MFLNLNERTLDFWIVGELDNLVDFDSLVLKSRRVVPGRLLQSGFEFEFADWQDAASDLCERWREI